MMDSMTKDTLIDSLAGKLNIQKKQAAEAVSHIFGEIAQALKRGEEVALSGFGSFKVGVRKARSGINPRTGAKIEIPERKVPKFRPAKGLKEAIL